MTAFEEAWDSITKQERDLILKFKSEYDDFPSLPLGKFLDFYPELLTENVEDILSLMPQNDRDYSRAMFRIPPHHQPQDEFDEDNFEMIRPSGWTYSGYAEPSLQNMVRDTKDNIIDPPPLDEVMYWGFQTGLGQGGASGIWNRLNYHNQLSPIQYEKQYQPSFGIDWKPGETYYSRPAPRHWKDGVKLDEPDFSEQQRYDANRDSIAQQIFPETHWAYHTEGFSADKDKMDEHGVPLYVKYGVEPWDPNWYKEGGGSGTRFYRRGDQPEWNEAARKITSGSRYVELPSYSPVGENIEMEGNKFSNAQELIAYLLSTDGREEWSEKKRDEQGKQKGLGSVSQGHDTKRLRRNIKDITDRQRDLM